MRATDSHIGNSQKGLEETHHTVWLTSESLVNAVKWGSYMKFGDLLDDLQEDLERCQEYSLIAVSRDAKTNQYEEQPIIDVDVMHESSEIKLIIEPDRRRPVTAAISLQNVIFKLDVPSKYREYTLFTGHHPAETIDDYSFRLCLPILAVAINHNNSIIAFLEWFEGFEKELGLDTE